MRISTWFKLVLNVLIQPLFCQMWTCGIFLYILPLKCSENTVLLRLSLTLTLKVTNMTII